MAQVPDLTAGEDPTDTEYINLGPTGMEGWIYNKGSGKMNETVDARQILVTKVDPGSPADGILAVDDVILGADGTGANPVNFTSDARKALAFAIDDAEGNNPAVLKLLRWRSGVTTTVSITLEYLGGSYTATAPYNCPKSQAILEKGIDYIMNNVTDTGYGGFAPTVLMAANDPSNPDNAARQARAQAEAYELNLSQQEIDDMTSGDLTRAIGKPWNIGPQLITQAEYYLQTGDNTVLPSIRARAIQIANAQSLFGTMGHHYSLPGPNGEINGPYGIGYGPVNNAGMPCFIGLILAEKCGLTDQEILDGIARAGKYFQYYADLGTVPYGENKETGSIANNGKSGLNAIALGMIDGYESQAKYFSKMSVFGASERDGGHTGPYFNHLWTPLGANYGGPDALTRYFSTTSWLYDLARRWDGDFVYHPYYQSGGIRGYGQGHKASWSTLLTYAAPLAQLHITGKGAKAEQVLDATDLAHIDFATNYDPATRTTTELIEDLKSPLPQLHWSAGGEIGANRSADHASILPTLIDMAYNGTTYAERHGAIYALGKIADDSTAPDLAALCADPNSKVRYMAANALSNLSMSAKTAEVANIVNGLVNNDRPMLPLDPENPMHVEKMAFANLLFDSNVGIWGGSRVTGADRALLYPAFRIIATAPMGVSTRDKAFSVASYLTKADVEELADVLVDVASGPSPGENSYNSSAGAIEAMQVNDFAEGVPASVNIFFQMTKSNDLVLKQLENYAGSSLTVQPDPEVIEFCKRLISTEDPYYFGAKYDDDAQAILDAIAADQLPEVLTPFKSVDWVFADKPSLTLPSTSTVLRVKSTDLAKGNSFYTWRKVHGAGEVSFAPNGTAAAKDTTVLFDGTPGVYTFEVTMADDKGLTEAYGMVTVTLNDTGGGLPPNSAPTANPDSITAGQGTPTQVILTGSDPEGQDLIYTVIDGPSNGYLTGTAPNLVYTSDLAYTGADSITFEVMDTEGLVSGVATVDITVNAVSDVGLAVYEPFDYPSGGFNGSSSANEIGLDGTWSAQSSMEIIGGSLNYGSLVTNGGALTASATSNSHAASRAISSTALAGNGLLDDGATMWFSAVLGHPGSNNAQSIYLALANDQFTTAGNSFHIDNDGAQLGEGLGVWVNSAYVYSAHFRDSSQGGPVAGTWSDDYGRIKSGVQRVVVGKITWGATSDTLEIYLPWDDLKLPSTPSSTLSVDVDQSTFDTLTISRNGTPLIDEIRLGATYQSVIQGTAAMVPDTTAPTPDPMNFAVAPVPNSPSSITMTATPAYDLNEVEYYFTCTAGGGSDSGWQTSNVFTDTGLTPGVEYSYTVKARDVLPAGNETSASAVASATIPAQGVVPDLVGILQSSAENLVAAADLSVGTITTASAYSLTVPAGHVLSQTPSAGTSAAYGSSVDLEISIGQDPALPTLAAVDIVDDQSGGPVVINTPMTYTLTFSEDIDAATLDAADFVNVGDASVTIGTITETSPGVVTVGVTPTSTGILRFAVAEGATIQDSQGDTFNANSATIDDTVITINLPDEVVPNVVGLAQATAESDIVAANLVVGSVDSIYDEFVPSGDVISQNPVGGSSIPGQSPVNIVVSLGPPPDTTGPVITSTDPADGGYNVEANANLHVTFDEDVFVNAGSIIIRNLTDGGDTIISVTDSAQVSTQLNVLTIDPATDLVGGKSYAIRIASGAVVDASGNDFDGINDNSTWNFSTSPSGVETILFSEDFEAPDVVAYSEGTTPASWVRADQGFNASKHGLTDKAGGDFSAGDPNHQAYAFRYGNTGITTVEGAITTIAEGDTYEVSFDVVRDDGANAGTPYDVRLLSYNPGDARNDCRSSAPGVDLIAVTGDARTDGLFSTVTFQYTVAAGDPNIGKDLALRFRGASTSANIDNVVVKRVTNPNDPDQVPPAIASLTPLDDAQNVSLTDNLKVVFDEDIAIGSGNIIIKNLNTGASTVINAIDGNQVLLNGDTLEINPAEDFNTLTFYAVQIEPGVITDLSGNAFPGISGDTAWSFNTGETTDATAPVILAFDPVDGATGVSYSANLTLTMDENVVVNSGNITLKNLTDSTQVVIDVTDSSQVTAAGPDIIIDPASYLGEGKNYSVQIDAGAILDLSGNAFAGIADDVTWNFTTSANNPPAIASLDPADESVNVDIATNLVVTFDEDVAVGTGNITLRNINTSGDYVIDVTDGTQVAISGPTLTINPNSDLAEASNYAILIDSGAVQDLAGNPFAGITSEATWNIATGVSQVGLAFSDDFEVSSGSPDVDASGSSGDTSKQTGPNWVRSTQAFGSDRHGIVDESSNQFTDPGGEQAYAFRYTNSGITTTEGVIGTLTAGKIYRVSFNVVKDGGLNDGGAYDVGLVTFAPGAARNDVGSMGNNASMVLATTSGNYTGTAYQLVSFEYISDGSSDAAVQGHDLAIRLDGATTTANIDNVQITINDAPNDIIAPTLASSDIVDDQGGASVDVNTLVTYTVSFSEDMNSSTVTAADFSNAGTAAVTIGTVAETVPGVFSVQATPTTAGSLQLQVPAGAVLTDVAGNALDTTNAIVDDTTITVNAPNNAPVAQDDSVTTNEDTPVAITLVATDADSDPLSYSVVTGPTNGTLSGTAPDLTYTPNASFSGSDSFTFKANDGLVDSNTATVSITVNAGPANNAPVASDDSVITEEDTSVAITLVATDADSDPLTYNVLTTPANGVLSGTAPDLTYTPNVGYTGPDSFTFNANDGTDDSNTATVSITVNAAPANGVVFADDFEPGVNPYGGTTPDVASYNLNNTSRSANTTLWVRSSDGFGSDRNGLIDETENTGLNFTDPTGEQAYGFRYTNSGVTTTEGILGGLTAGTTIDVSFDVVMDGHNSGTLYDASLLLFDAGATRSSVTNYYNNSAAVLARVTGNATGDGTYTTVTLSYVVGDPVIDNDGAGAGSDTAWLASLIGKDIALRFDGATTCANIDNVTVSITSEGGGDTTPPTLASSDIVDDAAGGPVLENTAVTYTVTFSEDMDGATVDVTDFGNAGTSSTTVDSVTETSPGVFSVTVTPTTTGSLQFQVNAGSALKDVAGNSLDTTSAILDDTTITVESSNSAPVASDDSVVTDEDTAVAVTLAASDADSDPLTYAVVAGPTNGVLSGTAPNLTYTPDGDYNGSDSFTFKANDGTVDSNIAIVSITVNAVNDAPVASDDSVATNEDSAVAVTLGATDVDGDPLTYNVVAAPANGVLSGTAPNLTYTPNANFNGSDSFTFTANDGTVNSNTATVSLTVNPVDDAPVASNDSVVTDEDTAAAVTLVANDVDGDPLTYSIVTGPTNGTLSGTAPNLSYTPNADYNGSDSFTFTATGNSVTSNTATVSITVNAVNDAPVASDDSATTDEDTAVAITLAATDTDSDPLTYAVVTPPSQGTLSGTAPNLTYTPDADSNGSDSFTFKANDGSVDSNLATVSLTVNAVDDAPVADDQSVTTDEDTAVAVTLVANDVDGDPLTYNVVSGPANGTLSGTAPNLTYTPNADYSGSDSFTFTATGNSVTSNTATVSITVNAVNDAPVASDDSVTTDEDTAVAITLAATDPEGDPLTYAIITGPANGTLSGTAPNLTYTPNANYSGADSFTFTANDGTSDSNTATVSITVNAVNSAPVANDQSLSTDEDTALAVVLTANDSDGDPLSYAVVAGPTNGTLSGTAPNLTYTPNADYNGSDSFTFKANDGTVDSNTATVSLTVNSVDDAPVASNDSVVTDEDTAAAVTLVANDVDGDPLTYSIVTGPTNGTLSGTAPNLTYTPNADYNGSDSFTFTATGNSVTSNTATVSITVNAVNDAPVASSDSATTDEDTAVAITLAATDTEGDPLTYAVVTGPTNGTLSGAAPNLTYTPNADYNGSDSFTFTANDGSADSNTATVSITVNSVNDAPVADDQSVSTEQDTALAIDLTASDAEGDPLTYAVISGPTNGTLSGTAPNLTYTPNAGYTGADSFTFDAFDGITNSNVATVSISVNEPLVGGVVFADDFEAGANTYGGTTPDVTTYTVGNTSKQANGTLWVRSGSGFGSDRNGLIDETENGGLNFTDPVGEQAYGFRYTNSGVTTAEGVIGSLTDGTTINVSFDVVMDGFNGGTPYDALLVLFDPAATRNAIEYSEKGTAAVLARAAGNASGDGSYTTVTFSYVVGDPVIDNDGDGGLTDTTYLASLLGKDIALRFDGATTSANIDNVEIEVLGGGSGNTAPIADDQSTSTIEDAAVAVTLTGSDADSDPLTYSVVTGPANGTLSGTAPDLTYTPNADYNGGDSFTFVVNDGTTDSNTATVSITVNAVNDAPVADDQSGSTSEDSPLAVTLTANDIDGDTLTYAVVAGPANGTLSGTAPNLTYTPNADFNGSDSFTFVANDGTSDSNTATVSLTVIAANDAPVADNQPVGTDEDSAVAVTLTASDIDGDALTYSVVSGPANGALSGTAPNLTYTPNADYNGSDSFTFVANDGTTDSNTATVSITVNPVNDTPVANGQSLSTDEDTAAAVTLTGGDIDGDALTYAVVTGPVNGTLSGAAPNLTYTPNNNYNGSDSFTFKVNDGTVDSTTATVNITVNAVDDAPVADDQSVSTDEDAALAVTLTASDVEGDPLTYAVVTGPANGTLSGTAPNLTYMPNPDYNGSDSFTFKATANALDSNTATVSVTVNAVNDAPVADDQSVSTDEDSALAVTLTANDVDGDPLSYTVVSGPANGTLSGTAPNLTYTPNADYNGSDSFTFVANDGLSDSNTATVSVSVNPINDAPVFTVNPIAGADATENETYTGSIAGSATDADGDTLTYTKVSGDAWLTVASDGTLGGTPGSGDLGAKSFTVNVSDGTAPAVEATLNITVNEALTTVPDVVGLDQATAESNIVAADLTVGTITEEASETVPAGDVISQGLTAGSSVPVGSQVDLVVSTGPSASTKLVRTTVSSVSNTAWTTVDLGQTYNSLVVVATPIHAPGVTTPVVTRITNVTSTGFDLKLDRADGQSGAVSFDVAVVAVEEGVYTQAADGVTMEAVKYTSTITAAGPNAWNGEARTYQNSYTTPVVLGQVMSYNDTNWSVFWSMGASRQDAADATTLNVGKHVGQDPNDTRANETIGYIVIESGSGMIDGVAYEAGLGPATVQCFGDSSTPYSYSLSGALSTVSTAAASQSGMSGNDGAWAVLSGSPYATTTSLNLHVSEDSFKDNRQRHSAERVGYIVFE